MLVRQRSICAERQSVLERFQTPAALLPAVALCALAIGAANPAQATSIPSVFLISEHTAPTQSSAELSFTTQTAYRVGLNGRLIGTSVQRVDNFDVTVGAGLSFNNDDYNNGAVFDVLDQTDQLSPEDDPNLILEPGQGTAAYYDSQAATWDNVNIRDANYSYDPTEQIDFGRNAPVVFNPVSGGFTELVIAELGGLNPFELWLCETASCQDDQGVDNAQRLFTGLRDSLSIDLFGQDDFAMEDDSAASELDQTWLFRFDAPVTGHVRLVESDNRSVFDRDFNARVQVDFIGVGGLAAPAVVPVPTSLPLLAGGLGLLGFVMRRRRKAA